MIVSLLVCVVERLVSVSWAISVPGVEVRLELLCVLCPRYVKIKI
jgi:hypothetical protein